MFLHEFQGKKILKDCGIVVPNGIVLKKISDIEGISEKLKTKKVVIKAQIHSGARGKAGGIIVVDNNYKVLCKVVKRLLGNRLVTEQTDSYGNLVNYVLVEELVDIVKEIYFSLFVDRVCEAIVLLVAYKGGSDVESQGSENFIKLKLDPLFKCHDYQIRDLLYFLKLKNSFFVKLKQFIFDIFDIFVLNDFILLEINPLVFSNGVFVCLDSKIEVDDNALCRQLILKNLFDKSQKEFIELEAEKYGLSYISLLGNIGCIVNGAGLAMATMDMIKLYGGYSANFLDIGGDATEDKVMCAFKVILLKKEVNCIFINIFGGIVRCDLIATSVVKAVVKLDINLPLVIRFIGNMSDEALDIIKSSKVDILVELDFILAVKKVIKFSKR